jgi:uncharacterized protein
MRKFGDLEFLFPAIRSGILAATLLEPERWWYMRELADKIETSPSSLQRELASLVEAGLLERRDDGRRAYFRANAASPLFGELRGIIEKTAGMVQALKKSLARFGDRIQTAFVYGSFARGEAHVRSDLDLLIVGAVKQIDLVPVLRELEAKFGREVNVTLFTLKEIRHKLNAGDHFMQSVLGGKIILLKGNADELGKLDRGKEATSTHVQPLGTR